MNSNFCPVIWHTISILVLYINGFVHFSNNHVSNYFFVFFSSSPIIPSVNFDSNSASKSMTVLYCSFPPFVCSQTSVLMTHEWVYVDKAGTAHRSFTFLGYIWLFKNEKINLSGVFFC